MALQGVERRFPPMVELTAYRIVQEALTNVARHAGVEEAIVLAWVVDAQPHDRGEPTRAAALIATWSAIPMHRLA